MLKPRLIDIHSHLNFAAFDQDREAVIQRALDAGVWMINVGTQQDTSLKAVEIARQYKEGVYAAIGLHPIHTEKSHYDSEELGGGAGFSSREEKFDREFYKKLAEDPKVVAIGECGLDYYRLNAGRKEKQKAAFIRQIELAIEVDKPLMIHCREAYDEVFEILREYPNIRANLHFFAADWQIAKKFLDLGFYLSFTGVVTFARQYDEVLEKMPLDRLMIETDAPYVAPASRRGQRNEPLYVEEIAKKIAVLRKVSFEKIAEITFQNTKRFFNIP